jgi:NTP pyrophosphatase (non-canonical NTP hydrolase)
MKTADTDPHAPPPSSPTTVADLVAAVCRFRDARDWAQFHTPKNLAAATAIEAAELQERFLWQTDAEVDRDLADPAKLAGVAEELADVVMFAMLLADRLGIDLAEAIPAKLAANEQKYPVALARGNARKYTDLRAATKADDIDSENESLLRSLKVDLPTLEALLAESDSHWGFEDPFYRFYHQSWKIMALQDLTLRIVEALRKHDQGRGLNEWFLEIVAAGTGKTFSPEMNQDWPHATRPILEAFFHAKTFLTLTVRYARALDHAPRLLPSGWGAVLYLYKAR